MNHLSNIPEPHRVFLDRIEQLTTDDRIVGVAAGGSLAAGSMDEFSDLDFIVVVEPTQTESVMANRSAIAKSLGHLLAAFTGEHVGEPRLLICLYDEPLLHVDFKFVSLDDFSERADDPLILWQRSERLSQSLALGEARFPAPDRDWIEARFWVWVHYASARIGRGELFETLDFLSFLRTQVLGPLGLQRAKSRPLGVRRIEAVAPELAQELQRTVACYSSHECLRALRASVELYRALRSNGTSPPLVSEAEKAAIKYLSVIEDRYGLTRQPS